MRGSFSLRACGNHDSRFVFHSLNCKRSWNGRGRNKKSRRLLAGLRMRNVWRLRLRGDGYGDVLTVVCAVGNANESADLHLTLDLGFLVENELHGFCGAAIIGFY